MDLVFALGCDSFTVSMGVVPGFVSVDVSFEGDHLFDSGLFACHDGAFPRGEGMVTVVATLSADEDKATKDSDDGETTDDVLPHVVTSSPVSRRCRPPRME